MQGFAHGFRTVGVDSRVQTEASDMVSAIDNVKDDLTQVVRRLIASRTTPPARGPGGLCELGEGAY